MGRTQEERKAETRGRLLAAAADLFARRGFHDTSADALAEAADRTSGALYAHFGDKEGLLLELLRSWADRNAQQVADALTAAESPDQRLLALWASVADPAPDVGDAWMLLEHELWLYGARHGEAADGVARRYAYGRKGMAETFEAWADEAGVDLAMPGESMAVLAMGLLLGLEMQRRVDPGAVSDDLATEGLSRLLDPIL